MATFRSTENPRPSWGPSCVFVWVGWGRGTDLDVDRTPLRRWSARTVYDVHIEDRVGTLGRRDYPTRHPLPPSSPPLFVFVSPHLPSLCLSVFLFFVFFVFVSLWFLSVYSLRVLCGLIAVLRNPEVPSYY